MKSIITTIAKSLARWVLGYAGQAAAYLLDRACASIEGHTYIATVCTWAEDAAKLFADFAAALKDSQVSDEERARVSEQAQAIADRAKELL